VLDASGPPRTPSQPFDKPTQGDYHRYLAEFQVGEKRRESADAALASYKCATDIAEHDLPPTHPIRLGLALNFSVFFYEIYNSPVGAKATARTYAPTHTPVRLWRPWSPPNSLGCCLGCS
jgi:hypothetical protein